MRIEIVSIHVCQIFTMGGVSDGEEGGEDGARKRDKGPNCKPGTQVGPDFNF